MSMSLPIISDTDAKILVDLGLSFLQARVYLTLVNSGTLTVKQISTNSKIARQDVYRITSVLQEMGLIEKHITIPTSFHALPIENGVEILLELRREKNYEIEETAKKFVRTYKNKIKTPLSHEEASKFILIPMGKFFQQRVKAAMERTQKKLDFLISERAFPIAYSNNAEMWQKLLKRDIKIRWIVSSLTENLLKISIIKPVGEFRFICQSNIVPMGLYDEKEVIIATSSKIPLDPCLWTDNRPLVSILQAYFDGLWVKALKL